jgi:predicted metal-dependent hydrolase
MINKETARDNPGIEYILYRTKRRTLSLEIDPQGQAVVRAPLKMPDHVIYAFVSSKQHWIERKREQVRLAEIKPRQYLEGELFPFLGLQYAICFADGLVRTVELSDRLYVSRQYAQGAARVLHNWYKTQARSILVARVEHYAAIMQVEPAAIQLSNAKRRWGSCSPSGQIRLNWSLVLAPLEIIDYVIVHELAHLLRHDHSKAFWKKVETVLPDYLQRRKWLRLNSPKLVL